MAERKNLGCAVPLGVLVVAGAVAGVLGFRATAEDAYGVSATARNSVNGDSITFGLTAGPSGRSEETLEPYVREIIALIDQEAGETSLHHDRNPYQDAAITRFKDREIIIALEIAKKPDAPDNDFTTQHLGKPDE